MIHELPLERRTLHGHFSCELSPVIEVSSGDQVRFQAPDAGWGPPEPGIHPTYPPRRWGGNIDCRHLGVGATLFLPISVDGALLSVGDGHARQADGEISSTAIECPIEHGQIRIEIDNRQIATPIARTATTWLTFGFHPDLDEAAVIAIESMLELLGREYGIEQRDAIALASVVVDVRLTQLVNGSVQSTP
jgi:acetamidase/formamidase